MRDYVDYFPSRQLPEKRGVSVHRDIDWWMQYCTGRMAKLLFVVLLAALALALKSFWQVGQSRAFFPVERITLNGDILITTPTDINDALADITQQSFLSVDLNAVSEQLVALPWIESAQVTRRWPATLAVSVTERKAAYRWGDSELVDDMGNRFANIDNSIFGELPKLEGVAGFETTVMEAYHQLNSALGASAKYLEIDRFVLNQHLSWELHLQSGVVVKFGRDDYPQRLERFAQAFQAQKFPDFEQLDVLDFRYNRGFAVKWKPEFTPETRQGKLVKVSATLTTEI